VNTLKFACGNNFDKKMILKNSINIKIIFILFLMFRRKKLIIINTKNKKKDVLSPERKIKPLTNIVIKKIKMLINLLFLKFRKKNNPSRIG
jgi:hypothetical protein